jgi:hypothetical protein
MRGLILSSISKRMQYTTPLENSVNRFIRISRGQRDPERDRLIALGWPDNEIDYLTNEAIADILTTDLTAPSLLYDPEFDVPITGYTRPDDEWGYSHELADREFARLYFNYCAFDQPITDDEIEAYARCFDLSKRQAELEIRRSRLEYD